MFNHVDWLGAVLAALAAFAVGGVWYAPPVFGNRWKALVQAYAKLSDEEMTPSAPPMAYWLLGAFINAVVLDAVLGLAGVRGVGDALQVSIAIGLGFGVPLTSWPTIFARQPRMLWLLNAGAFTAMQLAMGLVLGLRA